MKPRSIFFGALINGDKENFFGPLIMPGESTSQVIDLPDVIAPAPADAEIEVALQGVTEIDHRVGVRVNGIDVGEVTFTGRDTGVGTFAIAQALLVDGANTVSLDARGGELDYHPGRLHPGHLPPALSRPGQHSSRSARMRVSRSPSPASPTPGSVSSTSPVTSRRTRCVAGCPATAPSGRSPLPFQGPARGRCLPWRPVPRQARWRCERTSRRPCIRPARRATSS